MVSVDKNDNVIGFLSAKIDRASNRVSHIGAVNFGELNITFSKDFYKFLIDLFEIHNFYKIEWCVIVGNPAESMYNKIIERYHGNIIGISHESIKLDDGKYYDVKEYELFKRDYERNKNNKENKIKCHIKKTEETNPYPKFIKHNKQNAFVNVYDGLPTKK